MASEKKTYVLVSSDGDSFEVEEAAAIQSEVIKGMLEEDCVIGVIPVPNVTSKTLAKVIEYFNKHAEKRNSSAEEDADLKTWDAEFVKTDLPTLCDLLLAANFLNIKTLLDLTCQTMANMLKRQDHNDLQ